MDRWHVPEQREGRGDPGAWATTPFDKLRACHQFVHSMHLRSGSRSESKSHLAVESRTIPVPSGTPLAGEALAATTAQMSSSMSTGTFPCVLAVKLGKRWKPQRVTSAKRPRPAEL